MEPGEEEISCVGMKTLLTILTIIVAILYFSKPTDSKMIEETGHTWYLRSIYNDYRDAKDGVQVEDRIIYKVAEKGEVKKYGMLWMVW